MDDIVVQGSGDLAVWKREHLTTQAKGILKRTAEDILELSRVCHEFHEEFGPDEYQDWWSNELGLGRRRAFQILNVYERFGASAQYALADTDFHVSALYALAAPSVPDAARDEAIQKAESGEAISHAEAQELIRRHKEAEEQLRAVQEELAKKPAVVEKEVTVEKLVVPSDYEELVREKARLEGEKREMQESVESLKKAQAELKKSHSESAKRELEKLLKDKEGRVKWFNAQIESLTKQYQELDAAVGAQLAYKEACKVVEQCLLKVSFQLQEAFAEYPVPDEYVPKLEKIAADMQQGAEALRRFLTTGRLSEA
jgi:5-hydroxyisourate hydrolase-like protein (transthyretin family)